MHLDTGFLIDLQRETAARPGAASRFLAERPTEPLGLSVHVLCELEAGARLARHPERERTQLHAIVGGIAIIYPDERFAGVYAETYAALERRGKRMPAMDLLIAVAALIDRVPLVTPNAKDFRAVPDLTILDY